MTIAAVNAVIADVVLVAELDGLLLLHITSSQIGRPGDLRVREERSAGQYGHHDHTDPRDVVCTLIKKLRHLLDLPRKPDQTKLDFDDAHLWKKDQKQTNVQLVLKITLPKTANDFTKSYKIRNLHKLENSIEYTISQRPNKLVPVINTITPFNQG